MNESTITNLFFRKKFSLFLVFLVIFAMSFIVESRFVGGGIDQPVQHFNVIEVSGGVEVVDAQNERLMVEPGGLDFTSGDTLITHADSDVAIEVNGEGYFHLDSDSKLRLDRMSSHKNGKLDEVALYLESGRLWVNNVFNQIDYNIYTNKVLVIPGDSVFEMEYNGSSLYVYNHQHDVNLGLLSKPYGELERGGELEDLFYNYFFLPEGNRIQITEAKVTEKLATLLLSKLVKEFPISLVLQEDLIKDEFYQKNLERDALYADVYVQSYIESLKDTVVFNKLVNVQQLYLEHFERNTFPLMVSSRKSNASKEAFLSKVFDIGQVWSLSDDERKAERNSKQFYSFWHNSLGFLNFDDRDYLQRELRELHGVLYTSALYPGKKRVWDSNFDTLRNLHDYKALVELLTSNLEEVYDLIDQTEHLRALTSFNEWSGRLSLFLSSYNKTDLQPFYPDIDVLRQNVTNLFFRYSDFYSEEYFDTLTFIDQKVLELSPDRLAEEENRQTIVQDRIKILKKLSFLIQNNKIDHKDGIELGEAMLAHVATLRNQALYRVAIYEYFD